MNSTCLTQNDLILSNLKTYYNVYNENGEYNPENHLDKMLKIISGDSKISLRIVDWFVTNYAKKYYVVYPLKATTSTKSTTRFKVYDDYKLHLKGYNKLRFDPFCRRSRINIPYINDTLVETTIGQLNFFKWALENQVIEYICENYEQIEKDMNARNSTSRRKEESNSDNTKTRKKREELSASATKSIKKENVEIIVQFN